MIRLGTMTFFYFNLKERIHVQEAERTITCNSLPNYRMELDNELEQINNEEIWRVGREIRKLRL